MNIVIVNGNPDKGNLSFDRYLQGYQVKLHKMGHYVKLFQLRDMKLRDDERKNGSSPSLPTVNVSDDLRYIINMLNETDLLVWASPLNQGYMSAPAISSQKRIYQYFQNQNNHHTDSTQWMRAQTIRKIPLIGVIVQPESGMAEGEILLNKLMQERMAAEFQTLLSFMITTELSLTDAACLTFRSFDYRQYLEEACNNFLDGSIPELDSAW